MDGLVDTEKNPGRLPAMPKNFLTAASRKRLKSRKRLTPFKKNSRVINQFKSCHWETFGQWVNLQQERKLLTLEEGETAGNIASLHFNYRAHARHGRGVYSKADVYLALAELLHAIGGSSGLVYNLMVFYRYISSTEHSNLDIDYKVLKRQLSGILSEYKSGEK